MRDSRALGGIAAFFLSILSISALANPLIKAGDIEVVEDRYGQKVLKTTVYYDGSLGEHAGLGVLAQTDLPVKASAYDPHMIRKGNNDVHVSVMRPAVESDISFDSDGLQFKVYSISTKDSRKEVVALPLHWPSIEEYFDFGELPMAGEPYETITRIGIDEALGDIAPAVRDAHTGGVESSNIDIFYSAMRPNRFNGKTPFGEQALLMLPETTSGNDVIRLVASLESMGLERLEFKVWAIDGFGFKLGQPVLIDTAAEHGVFMTAAEARALIETEGVGALYREAGLEDYDSDKTYARLLDKAIDLNMQRTKTTALAAREIVEFLINAGYEHPRLYSQLAETHCCTHRSTDDFLRARRAIHNVALSINPEDQWTHALLAWDEAERGDFESAERHAELAVKYASEQNVWNINNYARVYALQGRNEEARDKYDALRGLKDLNAENQRAHRLGLSDYAALLVLMGDPRADAVYEELVTTYPEETACKKLEYAGYLASIESTSQRARSLLKDRDAQNCEGYASVVAFVDVLDWHRKQGSDAALRKALLRHEDLGLLIYSVASVDGGAEILSALSQRGVDLATLAGSGFNALQIAVLAGDQAALDASLEAGIDIDAMSEGGFSALMLAVYQEDVEMARQLLRRGARVDVESEQGFTVIDMVAATSNDAIKSLFARSST